MIDQFKCRNGTCISLNSRCDGRFDCIDYSDETQCHQAQCNKNQYKCANGTCIPSSWVCDSDNDCGK
jgi:low density lipoprotein-related protein 2